MGSDLLLNHVWIRHGSTPDWDGLKAHIGKLTWAKIREHPIYGENFLNQTLKEIKAGLLEKTDLIKLCFERGYYDRATFVMRIGVYDILVSGGDSEGDSLSEIFDVIQDWGEIPDIMKFGFYPDFEPHVR
jgi:hypothetical protein